MEHIRFFLDYGTCFWPVGLDYDQGQLEDKISSILSAEAKKELHSFLIYYDQFYSWGLPPSAEWSVEDCAKFNCECKRVLSLIATELGGAFIICNEQLDLTEDSKVLSAFYLQDRLFIESRAKSYYGVDLKNL